MDRLLILLLIVIAALLVGIAVADDGMARCQLTHSFDVCHASLH